MTIAPYFYDPDTEMADAALRAVRGKTHLIIVAPPGTGKVTRVTNALVEHGHRFWELRASYLSAEDLREMPYIRGEEIKMVPSPAHAMLDGDKAVLITDWHRPSNAVIDMIGDAVERGCAPLLLFFHHRETVPLRFAKIPFWEAKAPTAS